MKKITSLFLAVLTLLTVVLGMCSCTLADSGTDSDTVSGNVNLTGGDTYNVTVSDPPTSNAAAAAKAMLSAVSITAAYSTGSGTGYQYGSGVIYKMDASKATAYVVTNYHVVYNSTYGISQNIGMFLYGKESSDYAIRAEYIGGSMYYDIAVLKVQNSRTLMESEAVAATFANSDEMNVLDTVIAIGNASGKGISATVGHLSVESEYITLIAADDRTQTTIRVMRTDAAVNPGNSGGGLFNVRGEVVGIVNAKSGDDKIDNIGYAIPSNVAKSIVENIIYYCDGTDKTCVYRCMLGITLVSTNLKAHYDPTTGRITKSEDVVVESMNQGSVGSSYFRTGDIIKSITVNGVTTAVTRRHHVIDAMLVVREGMTVTFTVNRNGTDTTFSITTTSSMLEAYI